MSIITDLRDQADSKPPEWDDAEPIIYEQPATWLYWNPHGQLVIRQRGEVFEDNPFLFFSVENVPTLIAVLRTKLAELGAEGDLPEIRIEAEAAKRPLTAAERQRRRRDKSHESSRGQRDRSHENRDKSHEPGSETRDEPALPFSLSDRAR
jgi:hypothetical protein